MLDSPRGDFTDSVTTFRIKPGIAVAQINEMSAGGCVRRLGEPPERVGGEAG
jgi:hypothetical protein